MQMQSPRRHRLRTFLSRSKRVQFLSGLFLNVSIIAFVFVISFVFDYCYLWVLRLVLVMIEPGGSVGSVLAFVQAFSLYGAMILYFLTLVALVIFHLMNYNKMLWRAVGDKPGSLKFKTALRDSREAYLDALCLFVASLGFLTIIASLLFFIRLLLPGSSSLETFEIVTAVFLAAGYTGIFALTLVRYVEDLFAKLFGISLWQHVGNFFRRRFSRKLSGINIP